MAQTQAEKRRGEGVRWETTGEAEQVTAVRMRKKRGKQTSTHTQLKIATANRNECGYTQRVRSPDNINTFDLLQNDSK